MFSCPPCASKSLPEEYRKTAEELFPPGGFPEEKGPSPEAVETFANILGIGDDFRRLWVFHSSGQSLGDFLNHFQNNLDLLIQKTWVEKADEIRKEKLQDDVPLFIACLERKDYRGALEKFGSILEELAYLFFGAQSQNDDFAEYALRIDTQMGLFWWYGGQIKSARGSGWIKNTNQNVFLALLLLGLCYLTNF
jgi:hypothetical protein